MVPLPLKGLLKRVPFIGVRYLSGHLFYSDFRLLQDESEQHVQPSPQEILASLLVATFH
jgi:hypothetical protein